MEVAKWVPASRGFVPDGAVVGCTNYRGPICVARAQHNGCMIPGKLIAGLQQCMITWQGKTCVKKEYEVLCYAKEAWQLMNAGTPIPRDALPIGTTQDEGVLFVGRIKIHKNKENFILGKVASKDSKCYAYVTAEKQEKSFTEFEILTVPHPESYRALTNGAIQRNNSVQQNDSFTQNFDPNNMSYQNNNILPYQNFPTYFQNVAAHPSFVNPNYSQQPSTSYTPSYQNTGAIPKTFSNLNQKKKRNSKKVDNNNDYFQTNGNTQANKNDEKQKASNMNVMPAKEQNKTECCHLAKVPNLSPVCWDTTSACEECSKQPGSSWECLHCREILCRNTNQHMMSHALKTSHFVCISQENLAVWCFKCDTFLEAKDIVQALTDKYKIENKQASGKLVVDLTKNPIKPSKNVQQKDESEDTTASDDEDKVSVTAVAEKSNNSEEIKEKMKATKSVSSWLAKLFPIPDAANEIANKIQFVPVAVPFSYPQQGPSKVTEVKPCWVQCNGGMVPEGALSGGSNHQGKIYVARVDFNGALIPGKFIPSYKNGYASINGKEILKKQFEVLCHVDAKWVTIEETLPSKAVQGGYDKDFKPLYIGRLKQPDNTLVLGKIQDVDGKYQFIYLLKRKEYSTSSDFEVLVSEENIPVRDTSKPAEKKPVPVPRTYTPQPKPRPRPRDTQPPAPTRAAPITWVTLQDGNVATGAVVGGSNHKGNVYVARAEHNGEMIPGKLIPTFNSCYIAFNGEEVRKKVYQVLCESNTDWRAVNTGDEIPTNAIPAGLSGDETLYVGRVRNGKRVTIGKVEEQSKLCVALQDGKEISFSAFDILISTAHDTTSLALTAANLSKDLKSLLTSKSQDPKSQGPKSSATTAKPDAKTKKEKVFKLENLAKTDEEYKYVFDKMQSSSQTKFNIVKIEKITNSDLWDNFSRYCEKIKSENNGKINQRRLFHGSKNCKIIAEKGFDERLAKQSGMFGAGLYFAEHSAKSRNYANGSMLLCKVALGKMSQHSSAANFSHPPPGHHSVKGNPGVLNFPEYIVYRGEQALPQYLITYN